MRPNFDALAPVVKEDADLRFLHQPIKPVPAKLHPGVEAVMLEEHRRPPEAGARVAVVNLRLNLKKYQIVSLKE